MCGRNYTWFAPKSFISKASNSLHGVEEHLEIGPRNGLSTNPVPTVPLNAGLALALWWAHLKPHSRTIF